MRAIKIFKNSTFSLLVISLSLQLHGQVTGNSNLVKQERNVPSFTGIDVSSGIDVFVTQGSKQSVVIQAEENLQDLIITEVSGSILKIYVKKGTNIRKSQGMDAYITFTDLQSVNVSGGGDVESESLIKTDKMDINISGGGDLKFKLETGRTSCNISGGGDTDISGVVGDCRLSISGGGDLKLEAGIRDMDATLSGGGDAVLKTGEKSGNIKIVITGGGDLKMNANPANFIAEVGGGGDAEISAGMNVGVSEVTVHGGGDLHMELGSEKLKLAVSGGGDARLQGSSHDFVATVSNGSDLNAAGFKTVIAKVDLTGGSDARLYVTGALDITATGGGQVYLTGKPEVKNASLSGGSEIHNE